MRFLKKQKNSILFACATILLIIVIKPWVPKDEITPKNLTEEESLGALRCALDSLYVANQFLTGERGVAIYREMAKKFPDVGQRGATLAQIRDYLIERDFYTCMAKVTKENMSEISSKTILFVLKEGKPISHILSL